MKLAKLSVNASLDAQGQYNAVQAAFGLHHLGHANNRIVHDLPIDPVGIQIIRDTGKGARQE